MCSRRARWRLAKGVAIPMFSEFANAHRRKVIRGYLILVAWIIVAGGLTITYDLSSQRLLGEPNMLKAHIFLLFSLVGVVVTVAGLGLSGAPCRPSKIVVTLLLSTTAKPSYS